MIVTKEGRKVWIYYLIGIYLMHEFFPKHYNSAADDFKYKGKTLKISINENYWKESTTIWQKRKLLTVSNFSFCHDLFKLSPLRMSLHVWKGKICSQYYNKTASEQRVKYVANIVIKLRQDKRSIVISP